MRTLSILALAGALALIALHPAFAGSCGASLSADPRGGYRLAGWTEAVGASNSPTVEILRVGNQVPLQVVYPRLDPRVTYVAESSGL